MDNIIITSNGIVGTNFPQDFIADNLLGKKVLVVDNGTFGARNEQAIPENIEKFKEYGCEVVDLITLTNKNLDKIFDYDICYLMGGNIINLVNFIHETDFKEKLEKFLEKGIYISESAAGIILGGDVRWYLELKRNPKLQEVKAKYLVEPVSYKGLGIVKEKIYPHINQEKSEFTVSTINKVADTLNNGEYIVKSFEI